MKKLGFSISVYDLKPGMVLGEDIYYSGNLLLSKGAVIKPSYIQSILSRSISSVTVFAEKAYYAEIISNPVERFYAETYENMANIIEGLKKGLRVDTAKIFPILENILETVFNNKNSILLLTGFKGKSDYNYAHMIDVCIYSLATAKAMNLDYEDIVSLGMAAILHDVGKIKIPDRIMLKKEGLTDREFEEIKKHSQYGYDILTGTPGVKPNVCRTVLQHHERCDGSGYPRGLKGNEINTMAKVIAIADIYDALTSDRVFRKKVLPHEAAEYLYCISNTQIDSEITKEFLKNIAIYPKNCQVLLNTNEVGIITNSNENMPFRPIVTVTTDKDRNPLLIPYQMRLESHPDVFINQVFK